MWSKYCSSLSLSLFILIVRFEESSSLLPADVPEEAKRLSQDTDNEIIQTDQLSKKVSTKGPIGQIVGNPLCSADIGRICERNLDGLSDLDALECVLSKKRNEADDLSDSCNHALWLFRKNITENDGFLILAGDECREEFKQTSCYHKRNEEGNNLVNCLSERKEDIKKERCKTLLTRLEGVIFGDYIMMERFATRCFNDIHKFRCGRNDRISSSDQRLPLSQGTTIECLSYNISKLSEECAIEILRVAELQSDDFHLDRALYFSCRDDREKFCAHVRAGNSRVYKCLFKNKMENDMSRDCREQIYRRQKMGWADYKASGIMYSCKNEIKKFKCRQEALSPSKAVRLSQILLCLENAVHVGQNLNGDCSEDVRAHRKSLLEDYRLSPELLANCDRDVEAFCKDKGLNGDTLHCLMAHAQSRSKSQKISNGCRVELENLLKVSDISSDWRVDPVLRSNCQSAVERSECGKHPTNRILDCLMNLLTSDSGATDLGTIMSEECEATLLQIQYFVSRDFPMDSALFDECRDDAVKICHASKEWAGDYQKNAPMLGPLILSCLFRNLESGSGLVSRKCGERIRETKRRRALSVHLMPEIEEPCLNDLADLCPEKNKRGEELACLQEHLDEIADRECRVALTNFTEAESKDPTIDPYLWKYCRDVIENKCVKEGSSEDSDIVGCLIDLKPDMKNKKCRASVEHLQLLRLKDIKFSPKFKTHCHEYVIRYCNEENMKPLTPSKLVSCLSKNIRDDVVNEMNNKIGKGCRKQVRYLTLSRLQIESEAADTEKSSIYSLCKSQVEDYCKEVKPGGGRIFECLRGKREFILNTSDCFHALFKFQEEVSNDISLDLALSQVCSNEISLFCSDKSNLFLCLKNAMVQNKEGFDEKCGVLLRSRLIEQSSDLRLNPRLQKNCKLDIRKFCPMKPGEGRILACLKREFILPKSRLTATCRAHVESIIEGAAKLDIRIDNNLYFNCRKDIEESCRRPTGETQDHGDGGALEECLKVLYHQNKIRSPKCHKEVTELIQSTLVDIHVDPILNQACALDLVKRCDGVPPGEGRLVACLLNELELGKGSRLSAGCKELLSERQKLFQLAGNGEVESFVQLYSQVAGSEHKNYFLGVAITFVGLIFVFGLFCGRVSKKRASKDK